MTPDILAPAAAPEPKEPLADFEGYPVFYGQWCVAMAWKPDTESAANLYMAPTPSTQH